MSIANIIDYTAKEIRANHQRYLPFLTIGSSLNRLLENYFIIKSWNNDLGDVIPLAITNAFSVNIVICLPGNDPNHFIVLPQTIKSNNPYVII